MAFTLHTPDRILPVNKSTELSLLAKDEMFASRLLYDCRIMLFRSSDDEVMKTLFEGIRTLVVDDAEGHYRISDTGLLTDITGTYKFFDGRWSLI